jgi:glycosyltransferase involved in cell wall biosynthesis
MAEVCGKRLVSIVIPCYNEQEVLPLLREELSAVAQLLAPEYDIEIILVDDGSYDTTWEQIREFARDDNRFRGISLSRNFGHQSALTCGYDLARGDAVVSMDADLQDPPGVIVELVKQWRNGADIVYAIRSKREGEGRFKLWTAKLFYGLLHALGAHHVTPEAGDFRLLSRRALDALGRMREHHRFIRGMVGWIGFNTVEVHYERKPRARGKTKYPFRRMLLLAMDAIVSFSSSPLRLSYLLTLCLSLVFLGYLARTLIASFFFGEMVVRGWPSLILSVVAFGSMNLLCLGLLGEYVGRIYEQSKQRPLYFIKEKQDDKNEEN